MQLKMKTYLWHIVLIFYIIFIFSNSLTPAVISSENSGFALRIARTCFDSLGISAPWLTDHVIRKSAHFAEYTLLGLLLYQSMGQLSMGVGLRERIHPLAVFLIPFIDETLQLFTEGRSGQISDVWLDISGVVFGTVLYAALRGIRYRRKQNQLTERNHNIE